MAAYVSVICVLLRSPGHGVVSFLLAGQSGCLGGTGPLQLQLPSDSHVSECVKRWDVSVFLWELTICYPDTIFGEN